MLEGLLWLYSLDELLLPEFVDVLEDDVEDRDDVDSLNDVLLDDEVELLLILDSSGSPVDDDVLELVEDVEDVLDDEFEDDDELLLALFVELEELLLFVVLDDDDELLELLDVDRDDSSVLPSMFVTRLISSVPSIHWMWNWPKPESAVGRPYNWSRSLRNTQVVAVEVIAPSRRNFLATLLYSSAVIQFSSTYRSGTPQTATTLSP